MAVGRAVDAGRRSRPNRRTPVADEHDLGLELDPEPPGDLGPDELAEPADVGRRALPVVDEEVGVLLADRGAADPASP